MERNFVYWSDSFDGYLNLATDEWFLEHIAPQDLVLHFYQNENAVIIGKNQNPFVECDLEAMKRDHVQLVRRMTGGGAVYHDRGNLNFSFIAGESRYDREAMSELILQAIRSLGISCSLSGRNDFVCDGRKFSGSAFTEKHGIRLFHGTLLLNSDLDRLTRYLTVDPKKIRSKGIESVRSRVCNLSEFVPSLDMERLRGAIVHVFEEKYGYWGEWQFTPQEESELRSLAEKGASQTWCLGQTPRFDVDFKERFDWGGIELSFVMRHGKVEQLYAYSDAMDPELCDRLVSCLVGVKATPDAIRAALYQSGESKFCSLADVFSF